MLLAVIMPKRRITLPPFGAGAGAGADADAEGEMGRARLFGVSVAADESIAGCIIDDRLRFRGGDWLFRDLSLVVGASSVPSQDGV